MLNGRKVAWRIHSYLQDTEDLTYLTLLNATNNIYSYRRNSIQDAHGLDKKCEEIEENQRFLLLFDFFLLLLQRLFDVFGEFDTADVFCSALSPRQPTPN